MRWYAETPGKRTAQQLADATVDAAAGAGGAVARAGVAQQDAVGTLGVLLALVLAGLPSAVAALLAPGTRAVGV